jgi:hypothetical protein
MNILTTIEYFAALLIVLYLLGLIVVWAYDFKRNAIYRRMQQQAMNLENLHLSMAVLHAKKYKIMEDYRRDVSMVERAQQFILENLLLIRKAH